MDKKLSNSGGIIMRNIRYVNVSIPEGLAKAVDDFIKENPALDLRSRAQVVNFALRTLLFKQKKNNT